MQDISITGTAHTPAVEFRFSKNRLSLSGETYPENTTHFYAPIEHRLQAYLDEGGADPVSLLLALTYINSGSLKIIYRMVERLGRAAEAGRPVTVTVEREPDDDMLAEFADDLATANPSLVVRVADRVRASSAS